MNTQVCSRAIAVLIAAVALFTHPHSSLAQSEKPNKQEPVRPRILAHYMPWYEARPVRPRFGWHWTMNTFDPEGPKSDRPTLASHYRPLIGPYDSGDPDVLEYHALLMKLAGIDGVIIDWYGTVDFERH